MDQTSVLLDPPVQRTKKTTKYRYPLPALSSLDWEWGYKFARNEETGECEQLPLTLLDILYPTGEEMYVAENWTHHWLAGLLEMMMRLHLSEAGWLVFGNVFIHWGRPGISPIAPDVTAVSVGDYPGHGESYHVGRHGVNPSFVIEITSPRNRENDLIRKRQDFAAVSVPEYLVIDLWPKKGQTCQLLGYRLEGAFYRQLTPDSEGGLTFQTVGLRFVAVGRSEVKIFDTQTGEMLSRPDEWQSQVRELLQARLAAEAKAAQEAEARRAEAQARREAEEEIARLRAEIARLQGDESAGQDADEN